jgi:hypothetical protein
MATGPGLAKSRRSALVDVRAFTRVRTVDARWREMIEKADIVSEGAARLEGEGAGEGAGARVWYGSTSLILAAEGTPEERAFLAAVAERDLHARTRALRVAVREAGARAACQGARLGRSLCEIRVEVDPKGVRIDVDVQAPLIEPSHARRSART